GLFRRTCALVLQQGEELPNEATHICLHIFIRASSQEECSANRTEKVRFREVALQYVDRFLCSRAVKEWAQSCCNIMYTFSVVSQYVVQVVGVLVLTSGSEGQGLHHD